LYELFRKKKPLQTKLEQKKLKELLIASGSFEIGHGLEVLEKPSSPVGSYGGGVSHGAEKKGQKRARPPCSRGPSGGGGSNGLATVHTLCRTVAQEVKGQGRPEGGFLENRQVGEGGERGQRLVGGRGSNGSTTD